MIPYQDQFKSVQWDTFYGKQIISMVEIMQTSWKMATKEALDVFLSLKMCFFEAKNIIWCKDHSDWNTESNVMVESISFWYRKWRPSWKMATKEASGKVESWKFGFCIVKNIWNDTNIIQIGPVGPILWKTYTFYGGHLEKWQSFWIFGWLTDLFQKSVPCGAFVPSLVLVSPFERWFH